MKQMLYNIKYYAKKFFLHAILVIGGLLICGGTMYSVYWFNKNECDRVHNLGYETDFDFFGGCYVKVNGQWMPFKIQGVNVITENK